MKSPSDRVQRFFDGELSAAEADAFRRDLADSPELQEELHTLMQLFAASLPAEAHTASAHRVPSAGAASDAPAQDAHTRAGVISLASRRQRRRKVVLTSVLIPAAAAMLIALVLRSREATDASHNALALAPTRAVEARLSYAGASAYRPYDVARTENPGQGESFALKTLAELEDRGDFYAMAVAQLLMNEPVRANLYFTKVPPSTAADSDRAVLALLQGEPEAALNLSDAVLTRVPRHPQALWNRGLALRDLGLSLLAAEAFTQVAELGEPGWQDEARARAEALRAQAVDRQRTWNRLLAAGSELVATGGGVTPADARMHPGIMRLYFYDAVRGAPSPERVRGLQPIAEALDAHYRTTVLSDYLARIARADFAVRRPLAQTYAKLVAGETLTPQAAATFLHQLRRARQDDILLGAFLFVGPQLDIVPAQYLGEYRGLATATGDPWFALLAAEKEALDLILRNRDYIAAESKLRTALSLCETERIEYRCIAIESLLSRVYAHLHRVSAALRHAESGWRRARRQSNWSQEVRYLQHLGRIASLRGDIGAQGLVLAQAYLDEMFLRSSRCENWLFAYEEVANLLLVQGQRDAAQRLMERVGALVQGTCQTSPRAAPNLFRLSIQVRLTYERGSDSDIAVLEAQIDKLRDSVDRSSAEHIALDYLEGLLLLGRAPERGQARLRQVIAAADARTDIQGDVWTQKVRAYSYRNLIARAGMRGDYAAVLQLLAAESGTTPPAQCVVGVAMDTETVFVAARTADGTLVSHRESVVAQDPLAASRVIPPRIQRGLSACTVVDVYARAPYFGQPGLLAPEIAWRYRAARAGQVAAKVPRKRVVVADIEVPKALALPALRSPSPDPDAVELRGPVATPSRVLAEIADASEIEVHAHGLVNLGVSDVSFLVLSPDAGGAYELTAEALQGQRLAGAPLVVLGACHAALTTSYSHRPWSLAAAFLHAGARTVIASPAPIQDADADRFFTAVRDQIAQGTPPAIALRDQRLQHEKLARDWMDQVIVFE